VLTSAWVPALLKGRTLAKPGVSDLSNGTLSTIWLLLRVNAMLINGVERKAQLTETNRVNGLAGF
jgi:hypothetical protein